MLKRFFLFISCALSLIYSPVCAFELTFNARDISEDLRAELQRSSSLFALNAANVSESAEIVTAAQADYRNLISTLYRHGYYAPNISILVNNIEATELSRVNFPKDVQSIKLYLDAKKAFRFSNAVITPLPSNIPLDFQLPDGFAVGEIARSNTIRDAAATAIAAWNAKGYPFANVSRQHITANHRKNTVNVELTLDQGVEATFGDISFDQGSRVPDERLLSIAGALDGIVYSPEYKDLIAKRLRNTGTFRSVQITQAESLNEDNSLDLMVSLQDAPLRKLGFGAEISSLEGATLSAYWMHRNLTNAADNIRFDFELSGLGGDTGLDRSIELSYRRPATPHPKYTARLDVDIEQLNEPNYSADIGVFTIGFDVENSILEATSIRLGYQYSKIDDDLGKREFHHVILPLEGTKDGRDQALDATRGTYAHAQVMPYWGLNGSKNGLRSYADARVYHLFDTLGGGVLAARSQLGFVFGTSIAQTPSEMLFYSGGGRSVRGQPYQTLGISNDTGGVSGGRGMFVTNLELRKTFSGKISGVAFFDYGRISPNPLQWDEAVSHSGLGLGLRYDTGFGPLRLDIAHPARTDFEWRKLQIYIGVGQSF